MKRLLYILGFSTLAISCESPEARRPISNTSGSFINASAERNIKLNDIEHQRIEQIIEADTSNTYIASENGFWYYYNTKIEDDSVQPQFGDIVNFNYNVKDLNDRVIYAEDELKTRNYAMDQEELFSGLREGLKLMKAGETVTFLFPSQKAYGYYGDEHKIGTNIPIKCEVIVHKITQKQNQ